MTGLCAGHDTDSNGETFRGSLNPPAFPEGIRVESHPLVFSGVEMNGAMSHLPLNRPMHSPYFQMIESLNSTLQRNCNRGQCQPLSSGRDSVKSEEGTMCDTPSLRIPKTTRQACARRHILTLGVGVISCPCQQALPSYGSDSEVFRSTRCASFAAATLSLTDIATILLRVAGTTQDKCQLATGFICPHNGERHERI